MDTEDVFQKLKSTLVEQFELDPAKIVPGARLYEDLDLDSIDAVDLVIKLQERPHGSLQRLVGEIAVL